MEKLFLTCTWFSFRPQTFIVKMRGIAVLVVVVILFRRHASDKFQEAISSSRTWRFFCHCLSLKYVVSDHFRWSNFPVNQNILRMRLHRDQFTHGTGVWNSLSSACTSMWGLFKLFHPVKQWLKSFLLFLLLFIYNSSEPINSAVFSRAKPLRFPRLVKLNSFNFDRNVATHRKVFAPFLFIEFARKMILFFRFSLKSCVPFFHFFSSDS